jgi:hypothetical protein
MATCATMGQAAGTAATLAIAADCDNRSIYTQHLDRLQRRLLHQDQWLPSFVRPVPAQTTSARLSASCSDPEPLRDGVDRRMHGEPSHRWEGNVGDWLKLSWEAPQEISSLRLITDSKLHQQKVMPCSFPLSGNRQSLPSTLLRAARIEISHNGEDWEQVGQITNNHKRLVWWKPESTMSATHLRVVLEAGWGDAATDTIGLLAIEVGHSEPTGPITRTVWPTLTKSKRGGGA